MDYKKIKTDLHAESHDLIDFESKTTNIYESVAIMSKRSEQIRLELKKELDEKVEEFQTTTDTLEEVFENREQIEIARYYESLPKPTLMAVWEMLNDKIYYRNPVKETSKRNY